eukprot:gnl/Trimastix_PCT/3461.p1 GENE.gnl/Trimastix_PCT/3461~~gnl/Trimastix_PCT/3461.p1  ORF type:complete len:180 (+),score=28.60 gnl/Trimastix_PCT/3461:73-612(+)
MSNHHQRDHNFRSPQAEGRGTHHRNNSPRFSSPKSAGPPASPNQSFSFFLSGTASLCEEVDKRVLVILRDGKKLIGVLRTFDHFANIVLEDTFERIFVGNKVGDIPMGLQIIRGENVVVLGELDSVAPPQHLERVSVDEILGLQARELEEKTRQQRVMKQFLAHRGLVPEGVLDDLATS